MKVGIREAKNEMLTGIRTYLAKDKKGRYYIDEMNRLPFFLLGWPGIGKTAIVKQVAEELSLGYVSFSLTHHTRNSLLGLPVIKELKDGGRYTEFTMSEIIAAVMKECDKGHNEGILMLDEFNCVSETILPTMLAFLQTKNIGEYKLPEGWCIVLAGNPPECNKSARSLDTALTDRVRKLSIEFKAEDFLEFAKERGFHPAIVEYLKANHSNIYVASDDKKNMDPVTTRGWENLSNTLYVYEKMSETVDVGLINQFIKSDRVAIDFMNYYAMSQIGCEMKDLEKVFKGVGLSEYAAKWNKYKAPTLWSIIDYMGRILGDKVRGKSSREAVDRAVTNIFELTELMKQPMLSERLFGIINQDDELIKLMTKSGNRKYVEACKKYCKVA